MTELTIHWQRLTDDGRTCPRCGDTGDQVHQAAASLAAALVPLGIGVRLDERMIPPAEFEQAPLESNRILIDGRPLEDWLGGATGQSPCCDVCGPNECRTVTVDDTTYETVPADLIVRAGLLAAAQLLAAPSSDPQPCCAPADSRDAAASCCGPAPTAETSCCAPAASPVESARQPLPLAAVDGSCC